MYKLIKTKRTTKDSLLFFQGKKKKVDYEASEIETELKL